MTTIIAHVGDLHVNSSVGLMAHSVTKDDGQIVRQSPIQEWLWANWLDYWEKTAAHKQDLDATVLGIINGDWGDINTHSGFQLVEPYNYDTILEMMAAAVVPMLAACDQVIVVRGTEAHVGGSEIGRAHV